MEAQAFTLDQPFHGAYEKCIEITSHLSAKSKGEETHSDIEASLETDGRELLRLRLQEHVDNQGPGRVGEGVCGSDGVVRSHTRDDMETGDTSVFGAIRVARTGDSQRGVSSVFPRAAQLNLPCQGYAPRLQKRVAAKAATRSLAGVAGDLETATGVRIGKRQLEGIVCAAAQDFDAFYAPPCPEKVQRHATAKPMQVLTFDGKGVVMRKAARREETRKRAEARAPKPPRGLARPDKSNRKRLATVAGIDHIDPQVRSPQTVAQQCAPRRLVPRQRNAAPKPVGKQLWASLAKPRKKVMAPGFAEGQRRDPMHRAEGVVLVDGDLTQLDDTEQAARSFGVSVVIMVDIMHVLE